MTGTAALEAARAALGLSLADLWLAYFTIGGTKTPKELASYLADGDAVGTAATTEADHDAVVHALNEAYAEQGGDHPLPYRAARFGR